MSYGGQYSSHFHASEIEEAATPFHLATAIWNSLTATALFRCWHILLFYFGWATAVVLINEHVTSLAIQPTLLTVCVAFISVLHTFLTQVRQHWYCARFHCLVPNSQQL